MAEARHEIATLLAVERSDSGNPAIDAGPPREASFGASLTLARRLIERHEGQCFARGATGLLAQFPNAAEAVRCAVAIQQAIAEEERPALAQGPAFLRIGVSVGDVVTEPGGPRGEAVNIAVGLAALAVPGGICVSSAVYEHARHRAHVGFELAGEKKLKGVPEAVAIHQIVEPGVERGYFSLWEELKRRDVFRAGATYAVVAWLLIQAASIALPTFDSPPWVMQALIWLSVLGFPIALVLAWLYELTPIGLKRSEETLRPAAGERLGVGRFHVAVICILTLAVVYLIFDNYVSTELGEGIPADLSSVAVLAFENFSTDPEDEYFADGLADEILGVLGRIRELKVASRTASFYFKDKDTDVMTIASTLMVGHVLSGGVRRYDDRIRVTAALDDANSGDLLWTETYDLAFENILDLQNEIARAVASAIVPVLSPESQDRINRRPTENVEAYNYYLRGRDYLRQPAEPETLARAVQMFDRAIGLDASFAHAYAGSCEAHLEDYYINKSSDSFAAAESACHRSLTLQEDLWEVHLALGKLYRYSGQYAEAVLELDRAIVQQRTAVEPYLELAQAYAAQELLDEAEATFRLAENIESRYWGVHNLFGHFLWDQSRYAEAARRYQRVIDLVPDSGIGYDNLANAYLSLGEWDQAEATLNATPLPSRWTYANRGLAYYYRHEFDRAVEDHLQSIAMGAEIHASWGHLGDAYRFIPGNEDKARDAYERAIELAENDLKINPADWDTLARLNVYYVLTGQEQRARDGLERLFQITADPTAYFFSALVYFHLGELDRVYQYLRTTVATGWSRATVAADPDLASLHGQSAFDAIVAPQTN